MTLACCHVCAMVCPSTHPALHSILEGRIHIVHMHAGRISRGGPRRALNPSRRLLRIHPSIQRHPSDPFYPSPNIPTPQAAEDQRMSAPYGQYGGAAGGAAGMDVQGGGMAPVMAPQGVTYLCGGACASGVVWCGVFVWCGCICTMRAAPMTRYMSRSPTTTTPHPHAYPQQTAAPRT